MPLVVVAVASPPMSGTSSALSTSMSPSSLMLLLSLSPSTLALSLGRGRKCNGYRSQSYIVIHNDSMVPRVPPGKESLMGVGGSDYLHTNFSPKATSNHLMES